MATMGSNAHEVDVAIAGGAHAVGQHGRGDFLDHRLVADVVEPGSRSVADVAGLAARAAGAPAVPAVNTERARTQR